jgi:Flp pilus assembly protein TadG
MSRFPMRRPRIPGIRRSRNARSSARSDRGQSTVELALVLPVLVLFVLALVQTALVARDAVLVQDAARAAVREASVAAGSDRVRDAARRTLGGVEVEVHGGQNVGDPVEVRVSYREHTDLLLVGALFPDITLRAKATMRAER